MRWPKGEPVGEPKSERSVLRLDRPSTPTGWPRVRFRVGDERVSSPRVYPSILFPVKQLEIGSTIPRPIYGVPSQSRASDLGSTIQEGGDSGSPIPRGRLFPQPQPLRGSCRWSPRGPLWRDFRQGYVLVPKVSRWGSRSRQSVPGGLRISSYKLVRVRARDLPKKTIRRRGTEV